MRLFNQKNAQVKNNSRLSLLASREWRLNNLYSIIDKHGNKVPFRLNWAQMVLYKTMWYFNVILKARQLGMTTFICIFFLDAALFNDYTSCGIIAHNKDDAEKFFDKKIKFAYDELPKEIRELRKADTDSAKQLKFSNGSTISVGTSLRSDTLQYLHVSEYGKSCAKYPEKAKEIRTGALNTIQAGCFCFIESTAEGNYGDFHTIATTALNKQRAGAKLTELDFKSFFFPWHHHPEYTLKGEIDDMPPELERYFSDLEEDDGIKLSTGQKKWYIKKYEVQQDEMMREYPSTPEEAFAVPLNGAYYEVQIRRMIKEGRLTKVPYDETVPVHTVWDLGLNDAMVIWFFQLVGKAIQIIDYYSNTDKGFGFYKTILDQKKYNYGSHIGPFDLGARQHTAKDEPETRLSLAQQAGINFIQLPKERDIIAGINRTRAIWTRFWIDSDKCGSGEESGLSGLQAYRREYNDKMGRYEDRPLHNWASHPADGIRYLSLAISENLVSNTWYDSIDEEARLNAIQRRSTIAA